MEQLIPIASKLQDVLGALGQQTQIDLPQIVVVGGQSSGKSSVLESLVGRSFLPRGTGIVTRRPLILQLFNTGMLTAATVAAAQQQPLSENDDVTNHNSNNSSDENNHHHHLEDNGENDEREHHRSSSSGHRSKDRSKSKSSAVPTSSNPYVSSKEWGEFLHLPGRKFYDFNEIRAEIISETDRLTGKNKGIDERPIRLKVYSPRVLALTLVDLPGIAKVPVGDQPEDIEQQIVDMCVHYITNPNAIILAVTAANQDLANSDALKLARSIDPAGNRTIGVLTKLDLMDPGTDCAEVLLNQVFPLRRGYIAVVNRGQKDIMADLTIREGLKKEELFFRNHPVYSRDRNILTKCGTSRLAKTLNNILMHHIRDCLPDLKNRISHMMTDVQQELEALGSPMTQTASRSTRGAALLSLLSKFATNFASVLDGKGAPTDVKSRHQLCNELTGGARISYIFTQVFANSLNYVGAFDGLSDEEIRTTICNSNGTRPALFVPEISFDILVRRQLARLEEPGIQCVDLVYEELQRISAQAEPTELQRFPVLRERMVEVVMNLLRRCVGPTQLMVSNLIKIELAYINTSHPDFIGGSRAVAKLMDKIGQEAAQQKQQPRPTFPPVQNGVVEKKPQQQQQQQAVAEEDDEIVNQNDLGYPEDPSYKTGGSAGIMNLLFRSGAAAEEPTRRPKQRRLPATVTVKEQQQVEDDALLNNSPGFGPPSIVHLPTVQDSMKPTDVPPTERERVEMEVIKSLVDSYFSIVRKNFIDMVPKTIMHFLVNQTRDSLQNELVSELYREAEVGVLLQEAEDIASRRQTCVEMKNLLSKALEIVNEVRDFNTFK